MNLSNFHTTTTRIKIPLYSMLGINPMNDILVVLKYIDEIREYDKEILEDIYYGSLHESVYNEYNDNNNNDTLDSDDTQYDNFSIDNYSSEGYYFLTESNE